MSKSKNLENDESIGTRSRASETNIKARRARPYSADTRTRSRPAGSNSESCTEMSDARERNAIYNGSERYCSTTALNSMPDQYLSVSELRSGFDNPEEHQTTGLSYKAKENKRYTENKNYYKDVERYPLPYEDHSTGFDSAFTAVTNDYDRKFKPLPVMLPPSIPNRADDIEPSSFLGYRSMQTPNYLKQNINHNRLNPMQQMSDTTKMGPGSTQTGPTKNVNLARPDPISSKRVKSPVPNKTSVRHQDPKVFISEACLLLQQAIQRLTEDNGKL